MQSKQERGKQGTANEDGGKLKNVRPKESVGKRASPLKLWKAKQCT